MSNDNEIKSRRLPLNQVILLFKTKNENNNTEVSRCVVVDKYDYL